MSTGNGRLFDHKAALAAVEARVGTESFEALVAERAKVQSDMREVEALYGPYGLWDERRRALRGAIADEIRVAAKDANTKVTEALVEDAACNDPRYQRALDEAFHGKVKYLTLSQRIRELEDRLKNRDILLRVHIAEAGLSR